MTPIQTHDHFLGTYSILDASLYICATLSDVKEFKPSTQHLFHWAREGLASGILKGTQPNRRNSFINFPDLVSLRVIAAMRAQGIKHKEIKIAERVLQDRFGWEYPFAMADFWTSKPDIFMKVENISVAVSKHLQAAMEFIDEYIKPVHGLSFDLNGVSAMWEPQAGVLMDPEIQFGEPCIIGTRVPTQVIWSFYQAGDDLDTIERMYGLPRGRLERAIEWEKHIQETAAQN
jgi:uncharacterized protein (DUF433 family)